MPAKKPSRRNQTGGRVTPKGTRPASGNGHHQKSDRAALPGEHGQPDRGGPVHPQGPVGRPQPFLPGHRGNR